MSNNTSERGNNTFHEYAQHFLQESIRDLLSLKYLAGTLSSNDYNNRYNNRVIFKTKAVEQMLDNNTFGGIYVVRNGKKIPMNRSMFDSNGDYLPQK